MKRVYAVVRMGHDAKYFVDTKEDANQEFPARGKDWYASSVTARMSIRRKGWVECADWQSAREAQAAYEANETAITEPIPVVAR